ncbi:MAG TPA: helicase-related protein, partial [Casimicrobiaceae bacterium]
DKAFSDILIPGQYTETLLRLGCQRLQEVRARGMLNAGGLVLCKDQNHAVAIAKQLHRITGQAPDLIVSDDDRATSTIRDFNDSDRQWVVAVRKISEGVDIPRLIVLVYLTHTKTRLFFRQAVGRIARIQGELDTQSYVVMPDHPALVRHAQEIAKAQFDAFADDPVAGDDDDQVDTHGERVPGLPSVFDMVVDTQHTGTAGVIIEGQSFDPALAARLAAAARHAGCTEATAARLYLALGMSASAPVPVPAPAEARPGHQGPLEDQCDKKRSILRRLINKIVFKTLPNEPHAFQKGQFVVNKKFDKRHRKSYTLDQLNRAIAYVQTESFVDALRREP